MAPTVKETDPVSAEMEHLEAFVRDEAWAEAGQSFGRLMESLALALAKRDWDLVNRVAKFVLNLRLQIMLEQDIAPQTGPESFAWMLGGAATVLAAARTPERPVEGGDTEELILQALTDEGDYPVTSGDLAARCKRAPATVARALMAMRGEGLVKSAPAGRHMRNMLTEKGKRAYSAAVAARAAAKAPKREESPQMAWACSTAELRAESAEPIGRGEGVKAQRLAACQTREVSGSGNRLEAVVAIPASLN
ncbi:MAG TPA: hypothetical protein VFP12_05810 [Allosphingosinicella sp.]|nr:hypothetical protein [Allosphingosinicella sp.]